MRTTKKLSAVALTIGLAIGYAAWHHHAAGTGGAAPAVASAPSSPSEGGLAVRWAPGTKYVYGLVWAQTTHLVVGAGPGARPVDASMTLDVDIAVRSLGWSEGAYALMVEVERERREEVTLGGDRVDGEKAEAAGRILPGQQAILRMDARGRVTKIQFHAQTGAEARQALTMLVRAIGFTLPESATDAWEADEETPTGTAHVRYARAGERAFSRERVRYTRLLMFPGAPKESQALTAKGTLRFDAEMALLGIEDKEELTVGADRHKPELSTRSSFSLVRKEVSAFALSEVDSRAEDLEDETKGDSNTPRAKDQRRAKGMTRDAMIMTIAASAAGSKVPGGFVTRAGAFLRLHPEHTVELVRLFEQRTTRANTRGLILDALSNAGDAPAQVAMRQALESPSARAESAGDYALLVQRLGFVVRPERESAQFLASSYAAARTRGDETVARGAVTALGSAVRHLRAEGDLDGARAFDARIREDLQGAQSSEDKIGLLSALGNAATPEDADAIRGEAKTKDAMVRDQVAFSLRHYDTKETRATLLDLSADANFNVATSAFKALMPHSMGDDWTILAERVLGGKTSPKADPSLIALVGGHRAEAGATGDAILRFVLARTPSSDGDLRVAILDMLRAAADPPG